MGLACFGFISSPREICPTGRPCQKLGLGPRTPHRVPLATTAAIALFNNNLPLFLSLFGLRSLVSHSSCTRLRPCLNMSDLVPFFRGRKRPMSSQCLFPLHVFANKHHAFLSRLEISPNPSPTAAFSHLRRYFGMSVFRLYTCTLPHLPLPISIPHFHPPHSNPIPSPQLLPLHNSLCLLGLHGCNRPVVVRCLGLAGLLPVARPGRAGVLAAEELCCCLRWWWWEEGGRVRWGWSCVGCVWSKRTR